MTIESVPLPGQLPLFPQWRPTVGNHVTVTADLLSEPWADVIDPPFGTVERVGLVSTEDAPPGVAILVRTETGDPIVAMVSLALFVKSSTALLRASAGKDLT